MSKQTSLVTFTGRMGGISFYKRNGVHVARKSSGIDRARLLRDPKFERTRENMSEFAGLSIAVSSFLRISSSVKNLRDTSVRGEVSKLFRTMMKMDESGVRGKREIILSENKNELLNLELSNNSLIGSFKARFTASHSDDRKTATLTVSQLRPGKSIKAPHDATHFQLVQLSGILSDVVYNPTANRYQASDINLNSVSDYTFSEYIPVHSMEAIDINLETVLDADPLTSSVSVIHGVGILFSRRDGIAHYPLEQGKAMRLVAVY